MRLKWYPVLLAVACMAGCSEPERPAGKFGPASLDHSALPVRSVAGRVLNGGEFLGRPSVLAAVNDYLVVLDDGSDSVIHVLRQGDGFRVRSLGRRGEGPGEYKSAWSLLKSHHGSEAVWVFDVGLQRITRLDLTKAAAAGGPRLDIQSLQLRGEASATGPLWLGDTLLITPGFFTQGRLARFARTGEFRDIVGGPPPGRNDIPIHVRQHAYTGSLAKSESRGLVALATRHADLIEIYRTDGTLVKRVSGPFKFQPRFGVTVRGAGPSMSTGDDLRFGYVDVTATDDRIFALFSGRTREGYGGDAVVGRHVHVFDWDGKLVDVLELDSDLISLTAGPEGDVLFGIRHDPAPAVLAYPVRS